MPPPVHRVPVPLARMAWRDAVFLHWSLPEEVLRPWVPAPLELDLWEGEAWVSVVAFRMEGVRVAGVPYPSRPFPELNVRTYVRHRGEPGVLFLDMQVPAPAFAWAGRRLGLPYRVARLHLGPGHLLAEPAGAVDGLGERPPVGARLEARWQRAAPRAADARDAFLVERYAMFVPRPGARVRVGRVEHVPWPLEGAEAQVVAWGPAARSVGGRQPDVAHSSAGVEAVMRRERQG